MIRVQYRDPQSEEVLTNRNEESSPATGARVWIGFEQYQARYQWRWVPTSCIVYVRRAAREERREARPAA